MLCVDALDRPLAVRSERPASVYPLAVRSPAISPGGSPKSPPSPSADAPPSPPIAARSPPSPPAPGAPSPSPTPTLALAANAANGSSSAVAAASPDGSCASEPTAPPAGPLAHICATRAFSAAYRPSASRTCADRSDRTGGSAGADARNGPAAARHRNGRIHPSIHPAARPHAPMGVRSSANAAGAAAHS
jgi:hypothetical protein